MSSMLERICQRTDGPARFQEGQTVKTIHHGDCLVLEAHYSKAAQKWFYTVAPEMSSEVLHIMEWAIEEVRQ